jgi:copper chaperone CopZ
VTTKLLIQGMSCNHCVRSVGDALRAVPGVTHVVVQLPDRADVEHGEQTTLAAMLHAVQSAGYTAEHPPSGEAG